MCCVVLYCNLVRCTVLTLLFSLYRPVLYCTALLCTASHHIHYVTLTVLHCTGLLCQLRHFHLTNLHAPTFINAPSSLFLRNGRVRLDPLSSDSRAHVSNALTIRVRTMSAVPYMRATFCRAYLVTFSGSNYWYNSLISHALSIPAFITLCDVIRYDVM